jgi:hypothetical protein
MRDHLFSASHSMEIGLAHLGLFWPRHHFSIFEFEARLKRPKREKG